MEGDDASSYTLYPRLTNSRRLSITASMALAVQLLLATGITDADLAAPVDLERIFSNPRKQACGCAVEG